jgi:ribosomal protein L6P/L9E
MENIQNHIKGLNHGYKGNLKSSGILYLNKLARFKDENTLEYGSLEEF